MLIPGTVLLLSLACLNPVNAGHNSYDPTDIFIECDISGVTIAFNSTKFYPGLLPENVRVGDDSKQLPCAASHIQRGMAVFKMAHGDCHPEISEISDTDVRLTYKLSHHAPPTDQLDIDSNLANVLPPSGLIRAPAVGTSQQHELFTSCVMPKEGLLKASIEDDTSIYTYVGDHSGPYDIKMTLYHDAFLSNPVELDEEVPLGSPLWVGLKLQSSSSAEMYIRDCWATPRPDVNEYDHFFIKNGIIGEEDETFAPIDDVITSTSYGFSFDSFVFRGEGSRVYLQCNVYVCSPQYILDHPDTCKTPTYPAFYRGERDTYAEGSGSGQGMDTPQNVNQEILYTDRKKRSIDEEIEQMQMEEEEEKVESDFQDNPEPYIPQDATDTERFPEENTDETLDMIASEDEDPQFLQDMSEMERFPDENDTGTLDIIDPAEEEEENKAELPQDIAEIERFPDEHTEETLNMIDPEKDEETEEEFTDGSLSGSAETPEDASATGSTSASASHDESERIEFLEGIPSDVQTVEDNDFRSGPENTEFAEDDFPENEDPTPESGSGSGEDDDPENEDLASGSTSGSGDEISESEDQGPESGSSFGESGSEEEPSEESGSGSGSGSGSSPDVQGEDRQDEEGSGAVDDNEPQIREYPVFYVMRSFRIKHSDRQRRSLPASRVYPRHTLFHLLRNGATLAITIISTAIFSASALLLPVLFSGEKMRCVHVKPHRRVI